MAANLAGQVLAGRFRVERVLAHGGMAIVYVARQLSMDREVALKVLPDAIGSPSVLRFKREVESITRLRSPHVVSVYDCGTDENSRFYIAMELLQGETLRQRLRRQGALPPTLALHVAGQVSDLLAEAHEARLVHRDLKPENIFLCRTPGPMPFVKVLDFGLAKPEDTAVTVTVPGMVVGTPAYMAPEVAQGDDADGRSDLYSLALCAFEMLSGVRPFSGKDARAVMTQQVLGTIPNIHAAAPELGPMPALDEFFRRALAKDPLHRWQTADRMLAALDLALRRSTAEDWPTLRRVESPPGMPPRREPAGAERPEPAAAGASETPPTVQVDPARREPAAASDAVSVARRGRASRALVFLLAAAAAAAATLAFWLLR